MRDITEHTFRPANVRDPIDRDFCAVCGLHKTNCVGTAVREDDQIPLPPEPTEEWE